MFFGFLFCDLKIIIFTLRITMKKSEVTFIKAHSVPDLWA